MSTDRQASRYTAKQLTHTSKGMHQGTHLTCLLLGIISVGSCRFEYFRRNFLGECWIIPTVVAALTFAAHTGNTVCYPSSGLYQYAEIK